MMTDLVNEHSQKPVYALTGEELPNNWTLAHPFVRALQSSQTSLMCVEGQGASSRSTFQPNQL